MTLLNLPFWNFYERIFKSEYHYLDFDTTDYWFYVFITLLFLAIIAIIIWMIYSGIYDARDKRKSTKQILVGELIDKKYIGEQSSSGVGTAVLPNTSGGLSVGVISTSSSSEEEFILFIRADKVYKINCDMQTFYSKNIGDKIQFEVTIGGLSHGQLGVELYKY